MRKYINWKVRFQNSTFIFELVVAMFSPILLYMGLNFQDLTTWGSVFNLIKTAYSNPALLCMVVWSVYTAVVDPTTKGSKDSEYALNKESINPVNNVVVEEERVIDAITPVENIQDVNADESVSKITADLVNTINSEEK